MESSGRPDAKDDKKDERPTFNVQLSTSNKDFMSFYFPFNTASGVDF